MLRQVERRPWTLFAAARRLAELHAEIHRHSAPADLPSQRDQLIHWIAAAPDFDEAQKRAARERLTDWPLEGGCVCHGDFHPANIFLTARGPVIIDWADATRGIALADVARTSVLFESANLPPGAPWHIRCLMKLARRALHSAYLRRYLELRPGTMDEVEHWRLPQRMVTSAWKAEHAADMARQA
jgi:Ser/Thr protein kinase RdoA (MazF antagonist)